MLAATATHKVLFIEFRTYVMPLARIRNFNLSYEVKGAGPRVLFIGGSAGSFERRPNLFDSTLVKHFELATFDHRGIGKSESPDVPTSMADFAADAAALIGFLGWKSCHVVGYSFGGMVAQEIALNHASLVDTLALVNTTSGGQGGSSFSFTDAAALPIPEAVALISQTSDLRYRDKTWRENHPKEYGFLTAVWRESLEESAATPEAAAARSRLLEARRVHDTFSRLSGLRMPVLVIGSTFDGIAPLEFVMKMYGQIKGAQLEVLPVGHAAAMAMPETFGKIGQFIMSHEKVEP